MFPPTDLNLLDWSSRNVLAVGLHNSVYLWDATQGDIIFLMSMEREEDYICSVSWASDGNYLAVGTSDCKIQVSNIYTHTHTHSPIGNGFKMNLNTFVICLKLWDVEAQKRLRNMASHTTRVGSLSWNAHILSR